jgi:hypothetical protein
LSGPRMPGERCSANAAMGPVPSSSATFLALGGNNGSEHDPEPDCRKDKCRSDRHVLERNDLRDHLTEEDGRTFASILPTVVPIVTSVMLWNCAASNEVAICVLSPISTRKNATSVVRKMPREERFPAPSCSLSATTAQPAMAMNARPRTI